MNTVSIILPTFNRSCFLQNAFVSISQQTHTDWELIIVDDGSSDDTSDVVEQLVNSIAQPVKYIYQDNQGPAIARSRGIEEAAGDFIAFFDSDDFWLPHHLTQAIDIFSETKELDWLFSACQRVDFESGRTLLDSTFYTDGKPNPLFSLNCEIKSNVYLIKDKRAGLMQLAEGIDSGLQNSILRRQVCETIKIPPFRVGEDRLFILMGLKSGFQFGFVDDVTVVYNVHAGNTSDTAQNDSRYEKRIISMKRLLESYESTEGFVSLNDEERRLLNKRLADDYFWKLGYSLLLPAGEYREAFHYFRKALKLKPLSGRMWKSYILQLFKFSILYRFRNA